MTVDWAKANTEFYVSMCYPKNNQNKHIHSEDVRVLASFLKKAQPKIIVEIGACYGISSKLFASISKEFGGKTYSIEPCPQKEWYDNIKEYDLQDNIELIEKYSPWVNWEDKPKIDFLFIDGWHNYRNVITEYFYWDRYVNTNGYICFHDSAKYPGVKRAIEEIKKTEFLEFVTKSDSTVGLEIYQKVPDKRGKTAFFGPWVGEFGFEVAWWQGFCRKQAKNFDYTIVSTYPGNEGLYKDFASEIVPHNLTGQPMCGFARGLKGDFDFPNVTRVFGPNDKKLIPNDEQEFVVFGEGKENKTYDILLHLNEHSRKQYPEWKQVLEGLKDKKIACFGKKGSHADGCLEGTADLRGIPLDELAGYMRGAKVVVGPSSGIMHYASYCKANIVVWADSGRYTWGQTVRDRFEKVLNPFNAPVKVLDKWGWTPPANEVLNAITSFL
jgi:predicted O-methyltransferase YrrM